MSCRRRTSALGLLLIAGALLAAGGARAWTFETLYSFCAKSNCADGNSPEAGLLRDAAGTLYGTTGVGGSSDGGVVFALIPKGGKWTYRVLHSFCFSCGDGTNPSAGIIMDVNGNLYGTTGQSGPTGCGTVFELSPNADRSKWKETTLYAASCAPFGNNIVTGLAYQGQAAGAPYDGASPLYGTTASGGTGKGTVYQLVPKDRTWKETDLYAFCPNGGDGCTDGETPGQLIVDAAGNLFGNTAFGGTGAGGTVYELAPDHQGTTWSEQILYNFCSVENCTDGINPAGALVMDSAGNLFGTTTAAEAEGGTVYKLTRRKNGWQETVLCTFFDKHCGNGYLPDAGLILDASGNLYGTDATGGRGLGGTVFELSGGRVDTLHAFCRKENCADGAGPIAPLIMDGSGNLYGTATSGGAANGGTVFRLKP